MPAMTPGQPRRAPGPRAALALLLGINLLNYLDRYIPVAAEPLIRKTFFNDDDPNAKGKMGLVATVFLVSYMVAAPLFGWMGDRYRRWTLIGLGVLIWTLASGGSGLAATFAMLLVTRAFVGIGEAAYGPIAPTVIADMFPVEKRGAKLAWFYAALPVGSALGYMYGGVIAKHFSWRWAFYGVVPPGLLLALLAFLWPEPGHAHPIKREHGVRAYVKLLRTRSYALNLAGMTAMTFAVGGMSFWMPAYVHEYRKAGELDRVNAIFGAITVVAGLGATLLGGWVGDRLTRRWSGAYFLVSGVGMLVGFPLFLGMLYAPFPMAWVFAFLAVFCMFFNTGPTNTIIANVTPAPLRATAYAFSIFMIHTFGDAISPPIIGAIADATKTQARPEGDFNRAFLLVGLAIVLGGMAWLLGAAFLKQDTKAAEADAGPA